MKVAMYYSNKDVRIEEAPVPKISAGEILMRVEASGICGTDVVEWYRRDKVPLVLGHEVAGVVEEVGEGLNEFKKGDRISVSHHVPCGECHYCKRGHQSVCELLRKTKFHPGGFAEYLRIPAINIQKKGVYKLTNGVSFDEATFIEPLACVLRGQRLANFKPDSTVLVLGCGVAGLLHVKLAKAQGAKHVFATDICDFRLKAAKQFGADAAALAKDYTGEKLREFNDGRLADLVIICAGAESAIKQGLSSVERGGTVLFFAAAAEGLKVQVDVNETFWRNEVSLVSSYAASPDEHKDALWLIESGKINVKDMITHHFGLDEIGKGFKLVAEARDCLKAIIGNV